MVQRSPALVFRKDSVVQLIKRSKLFLVNEIELPEISPAHNVNYFRYEPRARTGRSADNSC